MSKFTVDFEQLRKDNPGEYDDMTEEEYKREKAPLIDDDELIEMIKRMKLPTLKDIGKMITKAKYLQKLTNLDIFQSEQYKVLIRDLGESLIKAKWEGEEKIAFEIEKSGLIEGTNVLRNAEKALELRAKSAGNEYVHLAKLDFSAGPSFCSNCGRCIK